MTDATSPRASGEVTDETVEVRLEIGASAETVFDYFVDPDKLVRWLGKAESVDPVPGGDFRVGIDDGADGEVIGVAAGSYSEVDRPKRLVITWGWDGSDEIPPGSSTVEIVLDDQGGSTVVQITHRGLPAEHQDAHLEGWLDHGGRLVTSPDLGDG